MLYVETNFLMGYATGRNAAYDEMLTYADVLRIPEICLMEALTTLKSLRHAQETFTKYARQQHDEIDRTLQAESARNFVRLLDEAITEYDKTSADLESRLMQVISIVRSRSVLIPSSHLWFEDHEARTDLIQDPTDELIFCSIRDDAMNASHEPGNLFFSEDKGYAKKELRADCNAAGLTITQSVDDALAYLRKNHK